MTPIITPKKLIEVALPLDAINKEAAREKSIRHGHPSTLHLWWARRPLAAARAVIFAQLVHDPASLWEAQHPGETPSPQQRGGFAQRRKYLFDLIGKLVLWENTQNEQVLGQAKAEIRKAWLEVCALNAGHPDAATLFNPEQMPGLHDPFAGGGTIPLEAQRLGLQAYASDLNPVAVLINKAMIEIPPKFAGLPPVHPDARRDADMKPWRGAQGLAEDVRRYGAWMRSEAEKRIGHLYPKVTITQAMAADRPDLKDYAGKDLTVIAWLWARTVKSPNPAFAHVAVPLVSTFVLSSKEGKQSWIQPVVDGDSYRFVVRTGEPPEGAENGTKLGRGANFRCILSDTAIEPSYIYREAQAGRMGSRLLAVVAEGSRSRVYLDPISDMEAVAASAEPDWRPELAMPDNPRWFSPPNYGLTTYGDLFTPRQLVALTTFSDLVGEAAQKAKEDYLGARASRPPNPTHARRNLPHWEAGDHPQMITFRTADSLPTDLLIHWEQELSLLPEADHLLERRKRIETALDNGKGACHLANPEIARLVENALMHFDGTRYHLHAWVIMPNHVHVLVSPLHGNSLSSIVHTWKSFTAKEANKVLGVSGTFWQPEYFDRMVRDDAHFEGAVAYIEANPVKAGLCVRAEDWEFGSARWGGGDWRAGRPRSQDELALDEGGVGAAAYAEAVAVYLAIATDKLADYNSSLVAWSPTRDQAKTTFGRQALPMIWDFSELNVFADAAGDLGVSLNGVVRALESANAALAGRVCQHHAQGQRISAGNFVSTDPPYYDNIGYADLSDFFYVWLRRALRPFMPDLFASIAVPKAEELVATPYRHGSKDAAEQFFLQGMTEAMRSLCEQAHPSAPVTIYYAFKQSETKEDSGTSSSGWETFLEAVLTAGFAVNGTWPMRTERESRSIGIGTNALASSIVLVCRKRSITAATISRREFLRELNAVLPVALEEMTKGAGADQSPVAPVDLSQAIIGPGMAVFSKYAAVLEADGSPMSVKTALQLINRFLAEDDFDRDSQFCLHWFDQCGWSEGAYGEADVLARAKATSVAGLTEAGVVVSGAGKVRLLRPAEYPANWDPASDKRRSVWESLHHLVRLFRQDGESGAGQLLGAVQDQTDAIRQLAYRLYTLCERRGWAEDARPYNELITAWGDVEKVAVATPATAKGPAQGRLFG